MRVLKQKAQPHLMQAALSYSQLPPLRLAKGIHQFKSQPYRDFSSSERQCDLTASAAPVDAADAALQILERSADNTNSLAFPKRFGNPQKSIVAEQPLNEAFVLAAQAPRAVDR